MSMSLEPSMRSIAIALVATVCVCSLQATSPTLETTRWWSHVRALADDAMEGRDTGSRGYERANINLDQVRPLFPLKQLTAIAVDESTLGDTIRDVAGGMGLRIQADPEPWRNLMRRADNWNFMQIGVPATGFVLAPEKGTDDEAVYKEWYARRYHTPLDDLDQPWDPSAAATFNDFFGRLVTALANDGRRPAWKPGSVYATPSR